MTRRSLKPLSALLSLAVIAVAPGIGAYEAAAQTVGAAVSGSGAAAVTGSVGAATQARPVVAPVQLSVLGSNPSLRPGLMPAASHGLSVSRPSVFVSRSVGASVGMAAAVVSPSVGIAARSAVEAASSIAGPAVEAGVQAEAATPGSLGALAAAVRKESPVAESPVQSGWKIGRLFDGIGRRKSGAETEGVPVTGQAVQSHASGLAKSAPEVASRPEPAPPVTRSSRGFSKVTVAAGLAVAALLLAVPGIALAATPAAAGSIGILMAVHPLASAFAAAAGAVYGLVAAHKKGAQPSAGEIMASVLRYGILAGAGVYVLLDLTQILFLGLPAAGLQPLPSALATAAMGQSAFQGKFTDPATSPADRLMTAFPAVAAALGLSLGIFFAAPTLLTTAAVGAMSLTGVASAVYAALYKPGKSAADGPSRMARGYVLQSLMTGIGLTVASPYLVAPFMALAAWGLWDIIATTYRELIQAVPDWFTKSGK